MLAWDGFWPGLGLGKAKAIGLGWGFRHRKLLNWVSILPLLYSSNFKVSIFVRHYRKGVNLIYSSALMLMVPKERQPKASAKIKDVNNQSELQVKSHQHIHNAAITEAETSAKLKAQMSISMTATAATALPLTASHLPLLLPTLPNKSDC